MMDAAGKIAALRVAAVGEAASGVIIGGSGDDRDPAHRRRPGN
jgi:hypothetical protein